MSRIGRMPIPVPAGVTVAFDGPLVEVTGPKGTLSHRVAEPISVRQDGAELIVERPDDSRDARSRHGLTRTLVANMVQGVTQGYEKKLEIIGVGYRVVQKSPTQLEFALGFSHPVVVNAPEGITFAVEAMTRFTVRGIDKQAVGETAANIRKIRKPEPYKGKGVRYAGEKVRRKVGKAGK
ncbi:MAG: 50S ribosomal protein L6, partial [Propionibacteriaceae bacterium]|nr:50S ribosomal protein L6 [Propionibacteriaceae bacterium]